MFILLQKFIIYIIEIIFKATCRLETGNQNLDLIWPNGSRVVYTIYKFISDKRNLISDSCNWISDSCNWISDSCNWISDSWNWISVLCNIISDKWNLISANEIEFQNHYLPIFFQRLNWMCLFWTYLRTLLVVSAIYTRKLIYFFANEIKLSFAKITGFN